MANTTKTQLRAQYVQKRKELSPTDRKRDSGFIRQRLLRHRDWLEARSVLVYVSYGAEVETHQIIEEGLRQKKRVLVPCVSMDGSMILISELHRMTDLVPGFYKNILEPPANARTIVDPFEVELALVPGLAFDRQGGRLGQGGGHFDRILPSMTNATRWGLAFSSQIHPNPLPIEAHDVRMQVVATEAELILPPSSPAPQADTARS